MLTENFGVYKYYQQLILTVICMGFSSSILSNKNNKNNFLQSVFQLIKRKTIILDSLL